MEWDRRFLWIENSQGSFFLLENCFRVKSTKWGQRRTPRTQPPNTVAVVAMGTLVTIHKSCWTSTTSRPSIITPCGSVLASSIRVLKVSNSISRFGFVQACPICVFFNWVSFRFWRFWWVAAESVLGFLQLLKILVGFDGEVCYYTIIIRNGFKNLH